MAGINTLGRLMIEIGLSDKFSPEIKKLSANIKSLEKDLKNMDKEFGNVSKSVTGLEHKQELLNKALSSNSKLINEHVKARDDYGEQLRKEKQLLDELNSSSEKDEKAILKKEKSIQSLINKYNREENAINKLNSKQADYQKQLDEINEQYYKLTNNIESYEEKLESISERTSLTNSELKAQQTILEANGKKWSAFNKEAEIVTNSLASAIETYKTHREELVKSETELSKLTNTTEAHRKELLKQVSVRDDLLRTLGEESIEYKQQAQYVDELRAVQERYEQTLVSTQEHVSEVRQTLASSKEEVAEYYKNLREVGSTEIVRNLKQTSNVLSSVSEATQGASAIGGAVAGGTSALFMSYETGLTKISTLVDTSVVDMDKVGKDIVRISNETGQSVEGLMESAYDALSSGVKIGELNEFLSTSAKLATAGFTSNADAVRLMSQVLNNYTEAGYSAEDIANRLIKTQDLGVLSVNDMASSMSESLSLASTFGLNFESVAAAFAEMTLKGTSASEAGTQVSRMLEELGDSGSEVSQILKDRTGKSFQELMTEGKSFTDVLGELKDYAEETGVSMTELWGSSNAGIGMLQIMSDGGKQFNEILGEINGSSGILQTNFDKLSETSEMKLGKALNELKNSFIEIGGALAPVIDGISSAISGVAGFINNLGDGTKTAIGYISGLVAVISPLLGIGGKLIGGLANFGDDLMGLGALGNILSSLGLDGKVTDTMKSVGKIASETFADSLTDNLDIDPNLKKTMGKVVEEAIDGTDTTDLRKILTKNNATRKQILDQWSKLDRKTQDEFLADFAKTSNENNKRKNAYISKLLMANLKEEVTEEAIEGTVEATTELATQGTKATGIFSKLWGVISAHPIGALVTAIGAIGVGWAVADTKAKNYADSMKKANAIKDVETAKQYMDNTVASIKADEQRVKGLKEVQKEFDALHKKGISNMNEKELTRYKELCKEIAELAPEMVVGYDELGNPIIAQNESLEANIKLIELKIKREKELAIIQAKQTAKEAGEAFEEVDKDYQKQANKNKIERDSLETKYETMGKVGSVSEFSEKSAKQREKELKQEETYLSKLQENRDKAIQIAQNRKDEQEILNSAVRSSASTYAEMSGVLSKSTEQQVAFNASIIDSMDFSEIDPSQYEKLYTSIVGTNAKMSEENMKTVNSLGQQQQMLEAQVMSGEITAEEYANQCDKIAQKYAEIYGIDVDTAKKLFVPQIDKTSLEALDADIDYCKQKIENGLKEMLNTKDNNKRIEMAKEILLDPEISDDTKERVNKMLEDNLITDDEILELGELVANGEVDVSALQDTLKQNLSNFGQMENLTLEMAVQFGDSVTQIEEVKTMIDSVDGLSAEAKVTLKNDIDKKNIEGITKTLKELPSEQAVGILVALQQTGEYTPQQLQEILNGLPPEVVSALKVMAENGDIPKQIAEDLGLIPSETNAEVKITADNSDVEEKKRQNEQPTQGSHMIVTDNSQGEQAKNYNQTPSTGSNMIVTDNSQGKEAKTYNTTPSSGTHTIGVNNSAVTNAKASNKKDTSSTHTINVVQKVTQWVQQKLFGNIGTKKSVSEPVIVPFETEAVGQPIVIDDFNTVVSKAQASIQASANTFANAENDAIATVQASGFTDTILASEYWSNQAVDHSLDLLQDYMAQLDRVGNKLDIVSAKIEGAFGTTKANLLKNQITLLEQQQAMLKKEQADAKTLANSYKSLLQDRGFKFDSNGAITNATSKILELEHALESAQKKQDAYKGDNKSKQDSLAKAVDNASDKLDKAKDLLSEYYDYSSLVGETEAEWREIANAIADVKNEIYEANKEQANFYKEAKTTELEYGYDKLSDQLDILESKMNLEANKNNTAILEEQISLLQQMQRENEKIEGSYRNQMNFYRNYLTEKGFKFDGNEIVNGASALNANKASDEIESIQDAYEQYMTLLRDTIPDLEKEWYDLANQQEDVKDEIKEIEEELKQLEKEMEELNKIKFLDNINDLEFTIEQLEGQMSLLEAQMEHTYGHNKQQMIQQQIALLEQQQQAVLDTNNALRQQLTYLQQAMKSDGFQFDTNGNILNTDTILQMAETQDEYDELISKAEEYRDIQSQVTSNKVEWQNLENSIIDVQKEIENLKYEIEDLREEAEIQELTNEFQVLQNQLDKLQAQQQLNGANLTAIYEQQIEVIEKQKDALDDQLAYQKQRAKELEGQLFEYGFRVDDNGTIKNTANQLEYLKNSLSDDEFERVNSYLEEYYDVALNEISSLENEMIGLQQAIEDIEEEKLDKAKEIEDKITDMISKQVEDRIEKIEEERDAQIEAISKAKEEYDKWRRDVDYEDDYNEQLEKVQELQAQLEIAKRDDSLQGNKRVADLMEQLKEEQKNLEDLVQDRIDTQISDMFEAETEYIENKAEDEIKNLEDVFTETNIAEIVAQAMKTGLFTDLEGNIVSLDTALLDFTNSTADAMGVMGNSIRSELLDNLSVALGYMQEMEKVSINLSSIDYNSQRFMGVGYDKATVSGQGTVVDNSTTDNSKVVNVDLQFNPMIQIEGTTDLDETQLTAILDRTKQDMLREVQGSILSYMK